MYLYTTVQVSGHVFVYYGSSDQSCICILWFKRAVMYLYGMVQVISHVFVYYGSSDQSCICILWFKWAVMYLYTMVQVISHVFVYYDSSDQSCFCILRFKWVVMYLYTTVQVSCHVFAYYGSSKKLCLCVLCGIAFVSSCDFSIGFWNYFDSVLFLIFVFHFISYNVHLICMVIWYIFLIKCSSLYQTVGFKQDKYLMDFDSIFHRVRLRNPIYILTIKYIHIEMWSCFLPFIIFLHKYTCFVAIMEKGGGHPIIESLWNLQIGMNTHLLAFVIFMINYY